MAIAKSYIYKVYRSGVFLGSLGDVRSIFNFMQDINTAGSMLSVDVAIKTDVASGATDALLDETGAALTDESGEILLTEGPLDTMGNSNDSILLRNGNALKVYEISSYWPNGKIMFSGVINKLENNYGNESAEEIVTATVYSDASELDNYAVQDGS